MPAVCAQLANASANRKASTGAYPMRQLFCLASQSVDLQRFVWAWVSVLGINCSNLLDLTMTVSFSETFLKMFSTDKLISLDDLNDNFLELPQVIILKLKRKNVFRALAFEIV